MFSPESEIFFQNSESQEFSIKLGRLNRSGCRCCNRVICGNIKERRVVSRDYVRSSRCNGVADICLSRVDYDVFQFPNRNRWRDQYLKLLREGKKKKEKWEKAWKKLCIRGGKNGGMRGGMINGRKLAVCMNGRNKEIEHISREASGNERKKKRLWKAQDLWKV